MHPGGFCDVSRKQGRERGEHGSGRQDRPSLQHGSTADAGVWPDGDFGQDEPAALDAIRDKADVGVDVNARADI